MRLENAVAADVLDRILSAYGFTMQKELSDKLGIAKSNVASWLQRGQVPGNVLVQCALDTGADVQWLVSGVFANANMGVTRESMNRSLLNGPHLINKMLQSGGKPVLHRIMEAYGFRTQKELSEYLGISTGTISTWVRRQYFPGDVVITCSLDTGASLRWIATGEIHVQNEVNHTNSMSFVRKVPRKILKGGKLELKEMVFFDHNLIPAHFDLDKMELITTAASSYLVYMDVPDISNGLWVLSIDGSIGIYTVVRRPGNEIKVISGEEFFTCLIEDVAVIGMVILSMELKY